MHRPQKGGERSDFTPTKEGEGDAQVTHSLSVSKRGVIRKSLLQSGQRKPERGGGLSTISPLWTGEKIKTAQGNLCERKESRLVPVFPFFPTRGGRKGPKEKIAYTASQCRRRRGAGSRPGEERM